MGNCQSACPMGALAKESIVLDIDGTKIEYPVINRNRCDWSKRYSLNKNEGPEFIGNMTNVEAPAGDVTAEDIAAACDTKDQLFKRRSVILERCLKECTARPKKK